jgi:hypothetical protein
MLCKNVLPLLSEFFDEALNADTAVQVSQHLDRCAQCREEFDDLAALHGKLKSLRGVKTPDYLGDLIRLKLVEMQRHSWHKNLRNEIERGWSKMRTTEGTWYVTKALGTVMTCLFFIMICSGAFPSQYIAAPNEPYSPEAGPRRSAKSNPAINNEFLYNIGESMAQPGRDGTFFMLYSVNSDGVAEIQDVLERPNEPRYLSKANEVISTAHWRPSFENGKAVSSHRVLGFTKITVRE